MRHLYRLSSFVIVPSLYEGFSLVPLEAIASGVPVVISEIPVHREIFGKILKDCFFDIKAEMDSNQSLIQVCKQVLADRAQRIAQIKSSYQEESSHFNLEQNLKEHISCYESVL